MIVHEVYVVEVVNIHVGILWFVFCASEGNE